jgi:hypothetical protein
VLSSTSFNCYYISTLIQIDPILLIASEDFFISGITNTTPNNLFVMRLTYGLTNPVWKKEINCLFASWAYNLGKSILSTDGANIFFAGAFGSTNSFFYFIVFQASDGALVTTIKRTSFYIYEPIIGMVATDTYVYGIFSNSGMSSYFFSYYQIGESASFQTSIFKIYDFDYYSENTKNFGTDGLQSYLISKPTSLLFTCISFSPMTGILYQETGHAYADSLATVISDGTSTFNIYSGYSVGTVVLNTENICSLDSVIYYTTDETLSVSAGTNFIIYPEVTWTTSSTTMTHDFSEYNGIPVPEWISIDASTGEVSGTSPWDADNIQYKMYIDTTISGVINQKLLIVSNQGDPSCNPQATNWAKLATHFTQVLTILGISMSLGIFALSGAYPKGIWAIVEQIQLIILIISKEDFIPIDVEYYLKGNIDLLFNFVSIPVFEIPFLAEISKWLDLEQKVNAASELELESRSTFKNHLTMIVIFLFALLFYLIAKITPNCSGSNLSSYLVKFRAKILFFFGYIFFVRFLLEAFLSLTLSSVAEIYQFEGGSHQKMISFIISIVFLFVWVALLLTSIFYSCKFRNQPLPPKFIFMEWFSGQRESKWAHLCTPLSLSRRLLFVLIIVLLSSEKRKFIFSTLICIQIIIWMHVILIRPFETTGDNILQIHIEAFITIAIVYFYPHSSKEKWSQRATDTFLGIIFANSWLIFIILFIHITIVIIKGWRNRLQKVRIEPKQHETNVENIQPNETPKNPESLRAKSFSLEEEKDPMTIENLKDISQKNIYEDSPKYLHPMISS